jgi:hypothetical protein
MTRVLLPIALVPMGTYAQPRLDTDRPDRTESAAIVPAGYLQMETGAACFPATHLLAAWSFPQLLFRAGVVDRIELRAEGEHLRTTDDEGNAVDITGPLAFGAKLGLGEGGLSGIRSSALASIGVPPSGSGPEGHPFVAITLLADRDLSERWSMGANLGMVWNDPSPTTSTPYSLTAAVDLSRHLGAFAELYGLWPGFGRGDHRWDSGATWAVGGNMLFDLSFGNGFQGQGWFLAAGFSFRIKGWSPSGDHPQRAVRRS